MAGVFENKFQEPAQFGIVLYDQDSTCAANRLNTADA